MWHLAKLFLTSAVIGFIAAYFSAIHGQSGGQASYFQVNNFSFIVKDSDINAKGYYQPNSPYSFWKIYGGPPPSVVCNTAFASDPDTTTASGWPWFYQYNIGDCGTRTTYLPVAFIIDWLFLALVVGVLIWLFHKFRAGKYKGK